MLLTPPAIYEDQVIDHREIYEECERQYGPALDFAIKSTYNPRTKKYFGFCSALYAACADLSQRPVGCDRRDARQLGRYPARWAADQAAARQARSESASLRSTTANYTLRAIMYSFGSSVQDADGNPALKSKPTLEVIKYVKALYQEAMTRRSADLGCGVQQRFMLTGTAA